MPERELIEKDGINLDQFSTRLMSADYFAQANNRELCFRMPEDMHALISNSSSDRYPLVSYYYVIRKGCRTLDMLCTYIGSMIFMRSSRTWRQNTAYMYINLRFDYEGKRYSDYLFFSI